MKDRDKCIIFLEQNGWKCDIDEPSEEYTSYCKDENIAIDFNDKEMIFIGETGDFLILPICYFSLIGVLMEYRQISCNYKSI